MTKPRMFPATELHRTVIGSEKVARQRLGFLGTKAVEGEHFRAICFGEALLAFFRYFNTELVSHSNSKILDILNSAFENMLAERRTFSPEDFALYSMSIFLDAFDESGPEALSIQRGAKQYLADVKARLSPEFQCLAGEENVRLYAETSIAVDQRTDRNNMGEESETENFDRLRLENLSLTDTYKNGKTSYQLEIPNRGGPYRRDFYSPALNCDVIDLKHPLDTKKYDKIDKERKVGIHMAVLSLFLFLLIALSIAFLIIATFKPS